jgi:lysophospholipase L1-like esterase
MGELAARIVTGFGLAIGTLILLLVSIEFGVNWIRAVFRGGRHGRSTRPLPSANADANAGADWPTAYFDEVGQSVRVDWAPYVGWHQRPFRGQYLQIDERGLRATPGAHEAGPDAVRIVCFGGSTMMGLGAREDHTIPAILARRLGELGYPAAITNRGQLGYNSTQATIALHQLLKESTRFDIAVFYDGINDMVCAEQTGKPDHVRFENWRQAEFNLLYGDRRRELFAAAVLAAFPRTVRRLRSLTGWQLRGPLGPAVVDPASIDIPALANGVAEAYAANLRLVRQMAEAYGFRPFFFWEPAITTKRVKTADELRWEARYTTDLPRRRGLYAAIIDAVRRHSELAAADDVIDLSALFDDWATPVYVDIYHLSEEGNAVVAEAMLPAIAAAIGKETEDRARRSP